MFSWLIFGVLFFIAFMVHPQSRGISSKTDSWIPPEVYPNFLTEAECNHLIEHARPHLRRSEVIGNTKNEVSRVRTSKQTWLDCTDPVVKKIYDRVANLTNLPLAHMEKLQVARYTPGQEYKYHHDACCNTSPSCLHQNKTKGLRNRTILMYLNDNFEGGATEFPKYKFKVLPARGTAVVFHPLNVQETHCHPLALHGGLPVLSGDKWIANLWIHMNAL